MRPLKTRLALTCAAMTLSLLLATASIPGCSGSKAPGDPLDMLHDDTILVFVYDMEAIGAGEAGVVLEEKLEDYWDATIGAMGILMNETESLTVGASEGDGYMILKGEFDFEYIRDDLNDNDYDDDDYRGYEVWSGGGLRDASAVALIEEAGLVLSGSGDEVQDILRNLARDLSARDGGVRNTLRAMDRAGEGLVLLGISDCGDELRGCEAIATSISAGDRYEYQFTEVVLFRNERTAESQLDEIEEMSEEGRESFIMESITLDGEFVIGESSIDEDDFADRVRIERGFMSW